MSAELTPFDYAGTTVRVVMIDGQCWAVAADICAALDITNPTKAVSRVDATDKLVIRRSDTLTSNQGIWETFAPQVQQVGLVSENGATDLILESRKPEARKFRRWLTHEVWPSIRDTGQYGIPAIDLSDPIAAIEAVREREGRALELAKSERAARLEAEAHAKALEAPASAWKHLASAEGDYEVADAAKVLSRDPNIKIGRDRLFAYMAALGWTYRNRATSRWKAYQTQVENGRLTERFGKPFLHEPSGEMRLGDPTIRITPKGMAELHKRLGGTGQLALVAAS